jgi:HD-like signal output (HDOD) protein
VGNKNTNGGAMRKRPGLSFIDNIEELRAIPSVVMELMGLLNSYSPTPDIEMAIVSKIELDPALTAFVLRFSNSSFFSPRSRINTISRALAMMGFTRTKLILMSYFIT